MADDLAGSIDKRDEKIKRSPTNSHTFAASQEQAFSWRQTKWAERNNFSTR
jgi:hypothetical protein